jgi:tetratricopeptide (TPR) repeat protein
MLALMGKLSSRNAALENAELIHDKIRPLVEERGLPIWIALSKMLEAEMLAARGNHATAITRLREAVTYADLFQVHESIARIQWAAGNEAAAVAEYVWMVANRGRAVVECYEGCQPASLIDWNLAFYQLARLHDEAGDEARAADYYRQFLDRWPKATGLPEWRTAEKRLAELRPAGK